MTTTVTHSIGTSSRDYSTIQAWEDACPANLVTSDEIWKGECYNDSEFGGSGINVCNFSGTTTDTSRYYWLTCAAGQSFADNASVLTDPLRYDQSKGVGLRVTGSYGSFLVAEGSGGPGGDSGCNVLIERLQCFYDSNGNTSVLFGGGEVTIRGCIIESSQTSQRLSDWNYPPAYENCLIVARATRTTVWCPGPQEMHNCTLVCSAASPSSTLFGYNYGYATAVNCAIFGFTTPFSGTLASYPAATDYNACDVATSSMPGTHNVGSLTFANQFTDVSDSTRDFRVKSGNSLAAGNPDSTHTGGVDIAFQTRSGTTPTIGAWEYIVAGGSSIATWNNLANSLVQTSNNLARASVKSKNNLV